MRQVENQIWQVLPSSVISQHNWGNDDIVFYSWVESGKTILSLAQDPIVALWKVKHLKPQTP